MVGRGLLFVTLFSNCALSLTVTPNSLESEDVKVMKCIVEALTEVLSRPHPLPVSQDCLDTLRTDDRLVSILRHHSFLKELQVMAVQGANERAEPYGDVTAAAPATTSPQRTESVADQSMLGALGGPGERSILTQRRGEAEEEHRSSQDLPQEEEASHVSTPPDSSSEGETGGRREERKREEEEEREGEEEEEEGGMMKKRGTLSAERRHILFKKSEQKTTEGESRPGKAASEERRAAEEQEEEEKGGGRRRGGGGSRRWMKAERRRAGGLQAQQEARRSPEVKELQMMAQRAPGEGRGLEEEGSASRRGEDPEIDGLAAIESELESVAQKLHQLKRG